MDGILHQEARLKRHIDIAFAENKRSRARGKSKVTVYWISVIAGTMMEGGGV